VFPQRYLDEILAGRQPALVGPRHLPRGEPGQSVRACLCHPGRAEVGGIRRLHQRRLAKAAASAASLSRVPAIARRTKPENRHCHHGTRQLRGPPPGQPARTAGGEPVSGRHDRSRHSAGPTGPAKSWPRRSVTPSAGVWGTVLVARRVRSAPAADQVLGPRGWTAGLGGPLLLDGSRAYL
jgi:hypothetical protein